MSLREGIQPRGSHATSKGCREGALLEVLDTSAVLVSCGLSPPGLWPEFPCRPAKKL